VDKSSGEFQPRNARMRQSDRHTDRNAEPSRNKRESKNQVHSNPFNQYKVYSHLVRIVDNRDHNTSRNTKGFSEHNERTPEWMDYNPENEAAASKSKQSEAKESDPEFINDLEAWKSKMKKQDQEKNKDVENDKLVVQNDSNAKTADISPKATDTLPQEPQGKY
jgi:hypothetical protein